MEFDEFVRTKILGYRSVHSLYRETSCDRFVGKINVPFLVLTSKDDPITPLDMLPIADLYDNPKCFMLYTRFGGPPDFLTIAEGGRERRYQPELTMLFFEEVRAHSLLAAKESF
jgi:predicted alpha/beta-fold hydrolase